MKSFLKLLYLLGLVTLLAGCATKIEYRYKTALVALPDNYLVDCEIAQPPGYKSYFIATPDQKEDMLIKYSSAQTGNLIRCNDRLELARKWKAENIKLYPQ